MKLGKNLYATWAVLITISLLLSLVLRNDSYFGAFLNNLAAGFVGSLLTVIFIDKSIQKMRDSERASVMNIALNELRVVLMRHLMLFSDWYRAVHPKKLESVTNFKVLFGKSFIKQIESLNLMTETPTFPKLSWLDYSGQQLTSHKIEFEKIVSKYILYLEPSLVRGLGKLVNSHMFSLIPQLTILPKFDEDYKFNRKYNLFNGDFSTKLFPHHIKLMLNVVKIHNMFSTNTIKTKNILW